MAQLIGSLMFITALSGFSFLFIAKAKPVFISSKDLKAWISAWFFVVFTAFIIHNIWLTYGVLLIFFFLFVSPLAETRIAYYFLLLCAIPQIPIEIPGIGPIRYILEINYPMFLTLSLLLPILIFKQKSSKITQGSKSDKYVFLYVLLVSVLNFRDNTVTNAFRESLLIVLTVWTPYFFISRYIQTAQQLETLIMAFIVGIVPIALLGIVEAVKHWHIYDAFSEIMTSKPARANRYDVRMGLLRATSIFAGPIVFGYMMVASIGLLLYFQPFIKSIYFKLALLLLFTALICSVARATWVCFILLILVYIITGKSAVKYLMYLGLSIPFIILFLNIVPGGDAFIDVLPVVGTSRTDTIEYRQDLMKMALIVFQQNPLFGSTVFLETPEMQSMIQGQGIIDMVNSYIQVALSYGGVGLFLFAFSFLDGLVRCFFIIKALPPEEEDLIRMGRILFATQLTILVIIYTVSSIDHVPVFYWAFVGIMAAYLNISKTTIKLYLMEKTFR